MLPAGNFGWVMSGTINPANEVDFYRFTAAAGSKVWIDVDTGSPPAQVGTSRDSFIDLLAADGSTVIETDDDDGTGNGGDGTIESTQASTIGGRTLTVGGTYFIRVREFSTGTIDPYKLYVVVTGGTGTAEAEPNNTAATANPIISGPGTRGVRTGAIGVAGDSDYYSVVAVAGNTVYFNADGDPGRTGAGTDLVVEFRDPADALLLSVDSSITGSVANPAAESADYAITASGTYYVRVRHFSGAGTGTYSLMVSQSGCGAPTADTSTISGRITKPDGSPVGGAVMRLSGSMTRTTVSDGGGNYRFNELETGSFYTVTPELANYSFSPGSRSFSLTGNMTDAGFTAIPDGSQTANPIDTTEYFVRQQYLDFLGREPDQGGLEYWSAQINQCNGDAGCISQKRIDVSAAFFMSAEFQQTGSYIYGLYAGTLGRTANYGEFSADRSQVVGGDGLDQAKAAFARSFVERSEFKAMYSESLTREQFVDAVIQTMTNRSGVDQSSLRNGLLSDYDNGGRALVARHAAEAGTFVAAEYNKAFVLFEYYGYLRRNVDQGGYAFWLDVLNRGAGSRGMVCSFLTSGEYQMRFSTVVTRSNAECQ